MIRTLFKYLFILTCIFYAGPAFAATYYVAKTGSDSNSCPTAMQGGFDSLKSKLTIAAGVGCLAGGDTLYIKAGTYSESLITPPTGSASAYTVISRYASDIVTLTTQPFRVFNSSAAYLELNGFKWSGTGIAIGQGPHHIRIQDCEVSGAAGIGISIGNDDNSGSGNVEIRRCKLHNNGATGYDNAIYPSGSSNNVIEHNEIYSTQGAAIQIWSNGPSADNNIIRYNYIHDMTDQNGTKVQGIVVGKGDNDLVYNNIIYHLKSLVSGLCCGGIQLTTGLSNSKIYNNTVYDVNSQGIYNDPQTGSGNIIKNNIVLSATEGTIVEGNSSSPAVKSNNLTSGTPTSIWLNPANHDFHLIVGSPAIDVGINLSPYVVDDYDSMSRPQGLAYDIGAYEYASGTTSLNGDINGDRIVNSLDWSLMSAKWLTNDTNADLNKDGVVNSLDWSIMSSNWLKTI